MIHASPSSVQIDVNQDSLHKRAVVSSSQPITIVESQRAYRAGDIVAANGDFLCYVVKGTKVRVLSRVSNARALLRADDSDIVDVCFVRAYLVAATAGGRLVGWSLALSDDAATIVDALVLNMQLPSAYAVSGIERIVCSECGNGPPALGVLYTDRGIVVVVVIVVVVRDFIILILIFKLPPPTPPSRD